MHADGLAAFRRHTTRPRPDFESLRLRPLTPAIGAELEAVDLSCPLPPVLAAELRRALDEYHVLVVRGQTLDDDAHKRVGRVFGELHVPPPELRGPGDFERLRLVTNADSRFVPGEGWHVDISCEEKPPFGSLLYMEKLPLDWGGGDTLFANMHLAYELLSPPMKEMLAHLSAVHDGNLPFLETAYDGRPPGRQFAKSVHPVVPLHPRTGRPLLYVNRRFTTEIVGLTPFESRALLEMLFRIVEQFPALSCRVRWEEGTLVIWDNLSTLHHAVWDYFPYERVASRVSVVGSTPVR